MHRLVLSVDLDEWYHSRRWVDGRQAHGVVDNRELFQRLYGADRPAGEIIPRPARCSICSAVTACGRRSSCSAKSRSTYPDLVREIAGEGHEIASHGLIHVDMRVLGPERFEQNLAESAELLERLAGARPVGYRAPNLVYRVLGDGDPGTAGVSLRRQRLPVAIDRRQIQRVAARPDGAVHPSYENIAERGDAALVELPLPVFPGLRIAAGSSIITRIIGFHWTRIALLSALRQGDTSYYMHPWEFGARPRVDGHWLRNRIFLRRMGPWLLHRMDRLLTAHRERIITAGEAVHRLAGATAPPALAGHSASSS